MASVFSVRNAARLYGAVLRREIHSSRSRHAITEFGMPAMSPTMTEGGIASWKKKEGESFEAGDILLEIETDKATIDVEAQEDGVLGKIILGDGTKNVPVGKVIAILAEEGDDISNIEISEKVSSPQPKNVDPPSPIEPSSPPSLASQSFHEPNHKLPFHSRPLFPSVQRLVLQNRLLAHDLRSIKGTGVRGMLTKGDILAHIGKASSPWGTSKGPKEKQEISSASVSKPVPEKGLDAETVRHIILAGLSKAALPLSTPKPTAPVTFTDIIEDYLPRSKRTSSSLSLPPPASRSSVSSYFDGLI